MKATRAVLVLIAATLISFAGTSYAQGVDVGMGSDLSVTPVPGRSVKSRARHAHRRKHHVRREHTYVSEPADESDYEGSDNPSISVGMGHDLSVSPLPPGDRKPLPYYPESK